jgi:phosphoribosylformylglycinamidine synthase
VWEQTSFRLERLQAAEATVAEEQAGLAARTAPQWRLTYTPEWTPPEQLAAQDKVATLQDANAC